MKKLAGKIFIMLLFPAAAVFFYTGLSEAQSKKTVRASTEYLTDSLTEVTPVTKGEKIIVPGFYFDDGSPALNRNLKKYLKNLAAEIKKVKYSKITVDGYTDNRGDNSANNRLSRARANAVKNELAESGIPRSKIVARAYGSSNPMADNNTLNGRIQNRRIEITVR